MTVDGLGNIGAGKYTKAVEKSEKSGIMNITKSVKILEECSHLLKAETNFADKNISSDILKSIDSSIDKQLAEKADFVFDEIKVAKFPEGDKSVLITNYEYGIHSKTQLYLNKEFFVGSSLDDINGMCESQYESGWWKSKSVNDLVNHEIMHAKINHYNSVEKIERLYQTLSEDDRVIGFCGLVDKDYSEFMNEMYVALQNGEEIEKKYIDIYN